MDTELRYRRRFKLHWTDVAERLVQPLSIAEHLDELKHLRLGLLSRVIRPFMHQLILERTEETLDHGIVKTVALATHARDHTTLRQQSLVGQAGIERSLIGVMDESGRRVSMGNAIRRAWRATC